jgi:hypothetical protein
MRPPPIRVRPPPSQPSHAPRRRGGRTPAEHEHDEGGGERDGREHGGGQAGGAN